MNFIIETLKDIFIGNDEDETPEVDEKFTLGDCVMSVTALITAAILIWLVLFIFG